MMPGMYDYGRVGTIGIGTPQANPTVEAEMRILLPPQVAMVTVRLTSTSSEPLTRLRDYFERLPDTLAGYDTLRPDAFGFACTGSSYLVELDDQESLVRAIEHRFGYQIITAAAAIRWQLQRLGARRIALASPYPHALAEAATAYWQAAGFIIVQIRRVETGCGDTRSIYTLGSADAQVAAEALRELDVDAVLLSGTGMPSLPLIAEAGDGPPLLSSNLCLAARLCAAIGIAAPNPAAWRPRLAEATDAPFGGIPKS